MIPGVVASVIGGSAPGDPDFANVVLLLRGDSTTDLSGFGHAASIGGGITIDSSPSSTNGAVGASSIRTNGSANAWLYPSATEWRFDPTYTLEFWVYFDSQAANWVGFAPSDFSRFMQYVGGTGSNVTGQGKYATSLGGTLADDGWHWCVFVGDGTNRAGYLDGARISFAGTPSLADGSDKDFELLNLTAANPDMRLQQIRYTQGVARYDLNDLTIPVQSAPWPES